MYKDIYSEKKMNIGECLVSVELEISKYECTYKQALADMQGFMGNFTL